MTTHHDNLDTEKLVHDLHGMEVSQAEPFICDYCTSEISIDEPVLYEAIQIGEMPNLKAVVNMPSGWGLDAARCPSCDIDTIDPATDGFGEVLVMLSINESNGVLSADASQLTVVDHSPDGGGYYPPRVNPQLIAKTNDLGQARWTRLKYILENPPFAETIPQEYRNALKQSKEIPPNVDI